MSAKNFTTAFLVEKTPQEVYQAINNVRGWWSGEITGETDRLGSEFAYKVPRTHHSTQKISELVPGKKIAWHVTDSDLSFITNSEEWKDTDIIFDITPKGGQTEVRFTHAGLLPDIECYNRCSNAWGVLVGRNLRNLIITGKTQPSPW